MALAECPECGLEISSDAEFCPHCGKVFASSRANFGSAEAKRTRTCPDCGHEVSRAANVCPNCGRKSVGLQFVDFGISMIMLPVFVVSLVILVACLRACVA